MDMHWSGFPLGYTLPSHLNSLWSQLSGGHLSGIALDQLDTPMMKQFAAAKEEVPDALLFFRMGDFYELFGQDAIIASDVCQITLTTRDKNAPKPIPMAGVPVVSHRTALRKCLQAGFKVAVCEQVEAPQMGSGGKGLFQRKITRIASPAVPGDLDDEEAFERGSENCYLASISEDNGHWVLAYVDASTGEFHMTFGLSLSQLKEELQTVKPKEAILLGTSVVRKKVEDILKTDVPEHTRTYEAPPWIMRSPHMAQKLIEEFFPLEKIREWGLNAESARLCTVAAILNFLKDTQRRVLQNIQWIRTYSVSHSLQLDSATKNNLDFYTTGRGDRKGSLFHFLNRCKTSHGARLLRKKLDHPYLEEGPILASHTRVEQLSQNPHLLQSVVQNLSSVADMERLLGRAAYHTLDPRGLGAIRQSLLAYLTLCDFFANHTNQLSSLTSMLPIDDRILELKNLWTLLDQALVDDPQKALLASEPLIKKGFDAALDSLYDNQSSVAQELQNLEIKERDLTGITTLKIGYNRVYGYYFEVSKAKANLVPTRFIRKQSLTTGERYVTHELKELEESSLLAQSQKEELEKGALDRLREAVVNNTQNLLTASATLAEWDVSAAFAQIAMNHQWVKPTLTPENATVLEGSVHPVLRELQQEPFVPNDIAVGDLHKLSITEKVGVGPQTILLITGPNMAGKSTVMRQLALSQVLCQMGSFVPAKRAIMGLCDRIFSRLGAGDNASKQQSTFMVEMLECAHMLRDATSKSLLIMDEVGRGTSTHDGLAIAWSILEDLAHRVQCRALFSTHYHELVQVSQDHPNVVPMHMEVLDSTPSPASPRHSDAHDDHLSDPSPPLPTILFTRRFLPGATGKSYGVHVAQWAGLPPHVVQRAQQILLTLPAMPRLKKRPAGGQKNQSPTVFDY